MPLTSLVLPYSRVKEKRRRRKWMQQHTHADLGIFKWQGMLIYWSGNCIQFWTMFVVWEDESQSNVRTHNLGLHFLALVSNLGYTLPFSFGSLFFWHLTAAWQKVSLWPSVGEQEPLHCVNILCLTSCNVRFRHSTDIWFLTWMRHLMVGFSALQLVFRPNTDKDPPIRKVSSLKRKGCEWEKMGKR